MSCKKRIEQHKELCSKIDSIIYTLLDLTNNAVAVAVELEMVGIELEK